MKAKFHFLAFLSIMGFVISCTKENNDVFTSEVIKQWTIPLSALNTNPAPANRTETGTVNFQLFSDNSIRYELTVNNLMNDDVLSGVQLKTGDPVSNGNLLIDFTPVSKFPGTIGDKTSVYGVITNIRQSLADSLFANTADLYLNLQSVQFPTGLMRGQLNTEIVFAADVKLTGSEEVPPVSTNAVGTTLLRLTANKKLYSNTTVINNEPNDPFMMAHIHHGVVGANGPVIVTLASSPADFGVTKIIDLDASTNNTVMTGGDLYVNAHSSLFPAGKIRGQLRN